MQKFVTTLVVECIAETRIRIEHSACDSGYEFLNTSTLLRITRRKQRDERNGNKFPLIITSIFHVKVVQAGFPWLWRRRRGHGRR